MLRGWFRRSMPRGLFGRSLLIIVVPMVVLQAFVTYLLFDRQWETVTTRISRGVAAQIALFVQSYETMGPEKFIEEAPKLGETSFGLHPVLKRGERIPDTESPAFNVLKQVFVRELSSRIGRPVWIDSTSLDDEVDIRIQLDGGVLQVMAERKRVMSTNTHVWVLWMIGTALILLSVAILFLRNQIRPIERLADAAEALGKGRDVPDFRPSGATEVRRAALAFLDMRERILRFVQQRTDMLAGVSHDLRTPLTRMKLELAMMGNSDDIKALKSDVEEMERMLEEYLAFARGQAGEGAVNTDIGQLLTDVAASAQRKADAKEPRRVIDVDVNGDLVLEVRPNALRRCVMNLVENAMRHGTHAQVSASRHDDIVEIAVDDDGPGIRAEQREEAFRPFHRLDTGRTLSTGGVGLGLAIARDIARGHGGDIILSDSKLGGLRAAVRLPV
ncbi:MAG: HAMP domain-containing protein [Alphaproteobacteria bacterium]|nr:HAMP domain-containing protein [Alphaproteobacteria bacterium]